MDTLTTLQTLLSKHSQEASGEYESLSKITLLLVRLVKNEFTLLKAFQTAYKADPHKEKTRWKLRVYRSALQLIAHSQREELTKNTHSHQEHHYISTQSGLETSERLLQWIWVMDTLSVVSKVVHLLDVSSPRSPFFEQLVSEALALDANVGMNAILTFGSIEHTPPSKEAVYNRLSLVCLHLMSLDVDPQLYQDLVPPHKLAVLHALHLIFSQRYQQGVQMLCTLNTSVDEAFPDVSWLDAFYVLVELKAKDQHELALRYLKNSSSTRVLLPSDDKEGALVCSTFLRGGPNSWLQAFHFQRQLSLSPGAETPINRGIRERVLQEIFKWMLLQGPSFVKQYLLTLPLTPTEQVELVQYLTQHQETAILEAFQCIQVVDEATMDTSPEDRASAAQDRANAARLHKIRLDLKNRPPTPEATRQKKAVNVIKNNHALKLHTPIQRTRRRRKKVQSVVKVLKIESH